MHEKGQQGNTLGVAPPVSQVRAEQEVKPVGFHKDLVQMAPEATRCAPAEEGGTEKPFEREEVLQ